MTQEKEYLLNLARDSALTALGDDSTYPQLYLERIAKRDENVIEDFANDMVSNDMWTAILDEAYEDGVQFSRADLYEIAKEIIADAFYEWDTLTEEERAEIYPTD